MVIMMTMVHTTRECWCCLVAVVKASLDVIIKRLPLGRLGGALDEACFCLATLIYIYIYMYMYIYIYFFVIIIKLSSQSELRPEPWK